MEARLAAPPAVNPAADPLSDVARFDGRSEYLLEEGLLVQGGLPPAVPLNRFHAGGVGQGQEARRLNRT